MGCKNKRMRNSNASLTALQLQRLKGIKKSIELKDKGLRFASIS